MTIDVGVTGSSTLRLLVFQALQQYSEEALLPMLEDGSSIVRTAVARELQLRGGERTLTRTVALLTSPKVSNREIAVFLLGQLGTPHFPFKQQTIPLIESRLIEDQSEGVREAAAAALGHQADAASVPALLRAATDPSGSVRSAVAASLGQFRSAPQVASALRLLAEDADEAVRDWALHSLSD
ncbi:HEAT repeat domain-containing protein [Rhizobacter sp. P5_C2]